MKLRYFLYATLPVTILLFFGLKACAKSKPLKIVENIDIQKYSGTWNEIARTPNWFERNCSTDITAEYGILPNGHISVVNQCKSRLNRNDSARGVGRKKDSSSQAGHFKVTFAPKWIRVLPFVWADYCVLFVDQNYQYAVVGEPKRKYLWFLARTKIVPAEKYDQMLLVAKQQGFDTSTLIRN